jgi:hypothetical protein
MTMRKCRILLVLGLLWAGFVQAQFLSQRPLPAQGERGRVGDPQPLPNIKIGSRVMQLAPGAVIYDQQNRSIVQSSLPPGVEVYYTKDKVVNVTRVFNLTDQ